MYKNCLWKRNSIFLLAVLLLTTELVSGQVTFNTTNWRFSNPKKFGFSIADIDFLDNNRGVAVGVGNGTIAYTSDGGANWTYGALTYISPAGITTTTAFSDVHYVSPNAIYAVGSNGCMVKSTDGGASWTFINTPLFGGSKRINTVWFTSETRGFIGGEWNTLDSIPKVYFTNNGGATWDSLVSPTGTITRIGYINNPNVAPQLYTVTGKGKEINRIIFSDNNTGYITGSSQNSSGGPTIQIPAVNTTTCLPTGGTTSALGAQHASLVWKFSNGTLTDYSTTKERLGYSGAPPTGVIPCSGSNALYRSVTPATSSFRALHIINDSAILIISNSNNTAIRVYTGRNDSTVNVATGQKEAGRYEIVNTTNPPNGFPTIPAVNPVFTFSGPFAIVKAANGKLFVPVNSPAFGPVNRMMTSVDTGKTWVEESWLPTGRNYSTFGGTAMDITPSGRLIGAGASGVIADSIPGGRWTSNYQMFGTGAYNKIDFADCNNGMAVGGSNITRTSDGGKTWTEIIRTDFASLNILFNSAAYVPNNPAKAYFATTVGNIYKSNDVNTASPTIDPVLAVPNYQMWDVATAGNDSVWAVGYTTTPSTAQVSKVYRSIDGGNNWTTFSPFPTSPSATNYLLRFIEFPTRLVGYVAGTRDTIWKTTDGGNTWFKLPLPTPGVTPQITYTDMFALDANTVFLTGNGFPRKVVFRTTDGGNTWQDISGNIQTIFPTGNMNSVLFHDLNNGYVGAPGGALLITNNGGVTWRLEIAPSYVGPLGTNNASLCFAPKTVPAGISFANRKLFTVGPFTKDIFEYGNPSNVDVNSTETVVNASCTNATGGSITLNTSGGLAPYTYSINGGAFQTSNVFTGLSQGPKTITIKDAFCGTLTKTVNVGFNDNLTLTTNNDTVVCLGATVPMLAATNGTGASFSWSPGGGLSATNISNPVATASVPVTYTVNATLNGCVRSKPVSIGIKPNPVISAGPDKTILDGDLTTLDGSGSPNPVFIAWTPGTGIITGVNDYSVVVKPTTTTTYTLTVRNSQGCTSTDNAVITVIPYCVKVMNAFTPNGDGTNDKWIVTNGTACITGVSVAVYNRYGNLVYKNDNYNNDWDGTYNGKPVPDATYYYSNTYRLIGGKPVTVKGDVTILR